MKGVKMPLPVGVIVVLVLAAALWFSGHENEKIKAEVDDAIVKAAGAVTVANSLGVEVTKIGGQLPLYNDRLTNLETEVKSYQEAYKRIMNLMTKADQKVDSLQNRIGYMEMKFANEEAARRTESKEPHRVIVMQEHPFQFVRADLAPKSHPAEVGHGLTPEHQKLIEKIKKQVEDVK